jgi:hypothetical protein
MNISVICAPQTFGCNTGMFSVDLAAWYFLHRHFPEADVQYLTLYPHKCDFGGIPFCYEPQHGNMQRLKDSDLILYWGDFQHTLHYRNAVAKQLLTQGICSSSEEALEQVREFLFLAGSDPALLSRTVLYGGTLLFNQADNNGDEVYTSDLQRLLRSARRVWVREPFSAFYVNQIQQQDERCAHGTDAAQLLGRDFVDHCGVESVRSVDGQQTKLGVFIGRSDLDAKTISSLLTALTDRLPAEPVWLNWGKPPFFMGRRKEFMACLPAMEQVIPGAPDPSPPETLAALLELDLLVSDTYHTCVNAWSFGIPALCLIDNSQSPMAVNSGSGLAGRDKRVAFYWTYNAAPFLLYSADLSDASEIQKRAADLSSLFADHSLIRGIKAQMSQHVALSKNSLLRTLRQVLD